MELPQPRPYGTEGTAGRKATHDFLSLYSHSTVQQDPSPPSQGAYLKTHDFLQPLECMGRTSAKEESRTEVSTIEKPPPPAPPPSVEHILPGGIGTYTISHISYFNQRVPKPEGTIFTVAQASNTDKNDDNSNCSSYSGGGFTLWQESSAKKGKTGMENSGERPIARDGVEKLGQWTPERPAQSSSNNHCNSFSSLSSSQPLGKKSQSFMDMIKSAKVITQDEDMDDDQEFVLKKEVSSTNKGELKVRVDGKSSDQKANTPRSKHSATEQRRRSKINDRFQMLRELIPHSDQKRDKASFLLEVIEYIQYLREKVHKYDGSYQGWNHEPTKLMPWKNNHRPAESFVDPSPGVNSGPGPALVFSAKLDEKNITVSPNILGSVQNTVESDMSTDTTFKSIDHCPGIANKAATFPVSFQPNIFAPVRNGGALLPFPPGLPSESENLASQPQHQSCQTRYSCTTDGAVASEKMKEQGLTIEGGTISISSVYSQGLLNTLTQALQSSGVDLSQASISVQIELGKRAAIRASTIKDDQVPSKNQGTTRSRVASGDGSDQALKKVKTSRS